MRYAVARYHQYQRENAYRIYITDGIRIITENTAKDRGGSYLSARYIDLLEGKQKDTRTGEQIVADVIKKAGIEVIG